MLLKYIVCFGLLAAFHQVSAESNVEPAFHTGGDINEYVDRMLELVRPAIVRNGFDPFKIEDISHDFWFKLILVNYTGHIDLKNGWLQDLSTIHRHGDAKAKYEKKLLTLSVDLIVDCLMANFDHTIKVFEIGPSGRFSAKMRKQIVKFSIQVDFERFTFHLQQFALKSDGDVKIKITGLGLADPIVGIIVDALTIVFKNSITEGIGKQIRESFEEIIAKLPPLLPPPPPPTTTTTTTTPEPTTTTTTPEPTTTTPEPTTTTPEPTTTTTTTTTTPEPTTEKPGEISFDFLEVYEDNSWDSSEEWEINNYD